VTYPVAITTAPSTPTDSGGAIILGGNSAADPAAWWINVPANALVGTYTSTVVLTIVVVPMNHRVGAIEGVSQST